MDLVPLRSEVLNDLVHPPAMGIIPGRIDLILDDLPEEEDMEEVDFRTDTHLNE